MRLPPPLHKRKPDTHKGDYGHLLILGGSPGLTGAVALASIASLRIGVGLVTVGIPSSLNNIMEIKLTEAMTLPLPQTSQFTISSKAFRKIFDFSSRIDALVIGCGGSKNPSTQNFFLKIIKEMDKPMVVDADGLNALAINMAVLRKRKNKVLILTPHLGEFSRLLKKDINSIKRKRKELAKDFALKYNLILVLKGHRSIITDGKELFENPTGNPGMATAGSGDVLAGIIGGLLAQGINPFVAARIGVYLHGLAGDLAAKEKTQSALIASDIIDYIPKAIKRISKPR